jgi:hypothetical protein
MHGLDQRVFGSAPRDDRGRLYAMTIPDDQAIERAVSRDHAERLVLARRDARAIGLRPRLLVAGLFFLLAIGTLLIVGVALSTIGGRAWMVALGPVVWIVLGVGVLRSSMGLRPRAAISALLAHDICPACSADLAGGATGDDGLVECERYSAAWRLAR